VTGFAGRLYRGHALARNVKEVSRLCLVVSAKRFLVSCLRLIPQASRPTRISFLFAAICSMACLEARSFIRFELTTISRYKPPDALRDRLSPPIVSYPTSYIVITLRSPHGFVSRLFSGTSKRNKTPGANTKLRAEASHPHDANSPSGSSKIPHELNENRIRKSRGL